MNKVKIDKYENELFIVLYKETPYKEELLFSLAFNELELLEKYIKTDGVFFYHPNNKNYSKHYKINKNIRISHYYDYHEKLNMFYKAAIMFEFGDDVIVRIDYNNLIEAIKEYRK